MHRIHPACCACSALSVVLFSFSAQAADSMENIAETGPMPMRFYSGNLSVGRFMHYWGTAENDAIGMLDDSTIAVLKRTGCTAMCDYTPWCVIEREEGVWDFSFLRENARRLREAGLDYNVFCWLHFPPKWYQASDRFVPYENMETGETIEQMSLWSPDLPRVFDEFYRRLAAEMGGNIAFLRVAMPSEYGEIGYCTGMTNWLRPQPKARRGYWCGDRYGRADFRGKMLKRYGTLAALNEAWGTGFATESAVALPDPRACQARFAESPQARQRWIDFVYWYNGAWVECLDTVNAIIRRHFPKHELIYSLGYASERAAYGNDQGRYVKAMARLGVAAQTPGNVGYLATRRVSSACRHYGVPYFTEPPGNVARDAQLNRIFMDLSNGVDCWFDYLQNLDRAKDYFVRYKKLFTGEDPVTTVAVWHPTADHWLHPDESWSGPTLALSDPLRDMMPYEVMDDRMIVDGALDSLGIRHLVLAGAKWLDRQAWERVQAWVKAGGVLVVLQAQPMVTVAGDSTLWERQVPHAVPKADVYLPLGTAATNLPAAYVLEPCDAGAEGYARGMWYQREPNRYRWTRPGAGFTLPVKPGTRYRVSVEASLPAQAAKATIEVNGRVMKTLEAPYGAVATFEIDPGNARRLDLRFGGEGWVPEEVGAGPDSRRLGLYVRRVVVAEADAPEGTRPVPLTLPEIEVDGAGLWRAGGRRLGRGAVVTVDTRDLAASQRAMVAAALLLDAGDAPGGKITSAAQIDGHMDGVLATRFKDKILYFNGRTEERTLALSFRERDFPRGTARPVTMKQRLDVPGRTMVVLPLVK